MILTLSKKNKIVISSVIVLFTLLFLTLNFQMKIFKYLYSSKVWAHRVNSIEKYQETQDIFSGAELDIVFNISNNNFDVNHPPAKSIGLTLFDFLKSNKRSKDFNLWLDFKNLNASNHLKSANKLDSIVAVLNINVENIIVESNQPLHLNEFSKKGFKTSYYLPTNISKLTNNDLITEYNLTQLSYLDFISSNVNDYSFLKENFPNTKILTWIINNPPKIKSLYTLKRSILNFKRNFIVLNDTNIEVVLFRFNSKLGNR